MSLQLLVTCITKPNPFDPHARIQGLGGPGWYMTEAQVISAIQAGTHTFVTVGPLGLPHAEVEIGRHASGVPFLKTKADGIFGNNLLALNQCFF